MSETAERMNDGWGHRDINEGNIGLLFMSILGAAQKIQESSKEEQIYALLQVVCTVAGREDPHNFAFVREALEECICEHFDEMHRADKTAALKFFKGE